MELVFPVARPIRAVAPTLDQEPISTAEARKQLEISDDISFHDDQLNRLIVLSREQVEQDTRVVCYTGSFTWKISQWPAYRQFQTHQRWSLQGYADWIELPDIWPITAVSSITYIATDGTTTTWDSSAYQFESSSVHQLVRLTFGQYWPIVRGDINGITFTLSAGYGSVALVPQRIKWACLMQLKIQWMLAHDQDASKQIEGYERLVTGLTRGTYT